MKNRENWGKMTAIGVANDSYQGAPVDCKQCFATYVRYHGAAVARDGFYAMQPQRCVLLGDRPFTKSLMTEKDICDCFSRCSPHQRFSFPLLLLERAAWRRRSGCDRL